MSYTQISKTVFAEIGHSMPGHLLEANRRIHGHSVAITVTATGSKRHGAIIDFAVFTGLVEMVVEQLDHRYLNDIPGLQSPTLESIAEWVGEKMATAAPLQIVAVKVEREHRGESAEWFA